MGDFIWLSILLINDLVCLSLREKKFEEGDGKNFGVVKWGDGKNFGLTLAHFSFTLTFPFTFVVARCSSPPP